MKITKPLLILLIATPLLGKNAFAKIRRTFGERIFGRELTVDFYTTAQSISAPNSIKKSLLRALRPLRASKRKSQSVCTGR